MLSPQHNQKFLLKHTVEKEEKKKKKAKEREGLSEGLGTDSSQNSLIPFAGEARGQIPRRKINLPESSDRISNSPVPWHAACFQTRRVRPRGFSFPTALYTVRPNAHPSPKGTRHLTVTGTEPSNLLISTAGITHVKLVYLYIIKHQY